MKKLILASGNAGTLRELQAMLGPLDCEVLTQAALGNVGCGRNDALPYFIECEHNMRSANECQGECGPMTCSDIEDEREMMRVTLRGAD